jgi:hypothetical protein
MNRYYQRLYNAFWFNRWLTRMTIRFLMKRMMLESVEDTVLYLKLHEWQNVHDYEAPSAMARPLDTELIS